MTHLLVKKRLFCTQGDYGLFRCGGPCCRETFDNEMHSAESAKAAQADG